LDSGSVMTVSHLPLDAYHRRLNARMGQFGDWEVPLFYTSILEEHTAVREKAGLFDISHMGEFDFHGAGALVFLESVLPRPIELMKNGQAIYMPLLNAQGGILDDILVYRRTAEHFLLIVNAGNIAKDFAHLSRLKGSNPAFVFEDLSPSKGLLALQGPASAEILAKATGERFDELAYYYFRDWQGGIVSRTGYTGEDGFEIMVDTAQLAPLWDLLFAAGAEFGLTAVGFGARDTLRLEAGMPLYGHDMDDETTPFEAGIGWAVKMNKGNFIGKAALAEKERTGRRKKLIGFEITERGIPRQGQGIAQHGKSLGIVTSGSFSPTLKKGIGMGFISDLSLKAGDAVDILIRNKAVPAQLIQLPFYKRKK